jgi:hypothetical protein
MEKIYAQASPTPVPGKKRAEKSARFLPIAIDIIF